MACFGQSCLLALLSAPTAAPDGGPATVDVLQAVDAFYASSWNHLIAYTAVLLAVVGVVVPVLLQRAQARLFRHEEGTIAGRVEAKLRSDLEKLTNQLRADHIAQDDRLKEELARATAKVDEILASVRASTEQAITQMKEELRLQVARAEGRVFHVQGTMMHARREFASAAKSYAAAAIGQATSKDESNLATVLAMLLDCLPHLRKSNFAADPDLESHLLAALKALKPLDEHGAYDARIKSIRKLLQEAKQR